MKTATKQVANIDLDKRTYYLLEGMPVAEMILEILKIKGYVDVKNITNKDIQISENITKRNVYAGYYLMSVHWDRENGYRNHLHVEQYFLITSVCKFLLYASFNPMHDNVLLTKWFIAES